MSNTSVFTHFRLSLIHHDPPLITLDIEKLAAKKRIDIVNINSSVCRSRKEIRAQCQVSFRKTPKEQTGPSQGLG